MAKSFNVASGNWSVPGNWTPSGVPLATDDVTIPAGTSVTVNMAAVCNSLVFGNLTNASGLITISGTNSLTINGPLNYSNPAGGSGDQKVFVGAGSLSCSSILFANNSSNNEDNVLTVSTGTVSVAGDLIFAGTSGENSFTISSNGTLNVGGAIAGNGRFTVSPGSTVNYNGSSAQDVRAYSYENLAISGSGTKTALDDISVGASLTVNAGAVFNMSTYKLSGSFASVSGTGTLQTENTSTAPIPAGMTWSMTVQYTSAADQTIMNGNYTNLDGTGGNRTLRSNGIIGIAGTFTPGSGTYSTSGSVVDFNGSGAQTIPAFAYEDLTSSSTGARVLAAGTISVGGVFTPGTNSYTVTGSTMDFNGGAQDIPSFTYHNLSLNGSGTKTAAGNINVNATLTISSGRIFNLVTYILGGSLSTFSGSGTLRTQNTSSSPLPGGRTWPFRVEYNSGSAQTIVDGNYIDLDIAGGNRTLNPTGVIGISGTFTTGSGTFTVTNSTVDFNGGLQSIPLFTFNHLTCSGTGDKTASGTLTVNGTLTITGGRVLDMGAQTMLGTVAATSGTGTLKTQATVAAPIPAGKTWNFTVQYNRPGTQTVVNGNYADLDLTGGGRTLSATGTVGITGVFTPGAGPFTVTSSTVDFNGATQSIPAFTFANLTISGSGDKTAAGALVVNGTLTVSSGRVLDATTFAISGAIVPAGTGALNTQNTTATPIPAGLTWTFDVALNGPAQTVVAGTYANLICSGSGDKTAAGAITVSNTLTVNSGRVLNMSTFALSGITATSGTGTIRTQAAGATPIPSGKTWIFDIDYNGTGAQTVVAGTYASLTVSSARTINSVTLVNGGTINVTGTFTASATFTLGSIITTGNTFAFTGAAQNIPSFTFNNLTAGGTGDKTATGALTVNGILTVNSGLTLDMATFALSGIASTSGTGQLTTQATGATPLPAGDTWTFDVEFNGATQSIVAGTYTNLLCTGSGDKTATGGITVNNTLTVNSGIVLNMATFALAGITSTSGTGTIRTQATGAAPLPSAKSWAFDVEYNGTGAQTIVAGDYVNLTISGARTINSVTLINATINVTGVFDATATFLGGGYITTGNTFVFAGGSQSIPAFTFNNLTCAGTGDKTATGAITVNGTLTISSGRTLAMSSFVLSGVASTGGSGTLSTQNMTAAPIPAGVTWPFTVQYSAASPQTIVNGNYIILNGTGGDRTLHNTGTIGISSTFIPGSGTYTVTSSTVNFNGSGSQTIPSFSFNNLTSSSTGARTLGTSVRIAGTFTPGTNSYTIAGSLVDFNGAAQNIPAFTFNSLSCSGSGTKTAQGAIVVNSTLSIASGCVLNMATFALTGITGTSGTGSLQTQNTTATPLPSGDTWAFTVLYNSASAQTIVHGSYTDLNGSGGNRTLSSSGTIFIGGSFTTGSGTYTTSGTIVNFNGTGSQTIPALTYNDLTSSSTGARTLASSGTIGIGGIFTPGNNSYTVTGSTVNFTGAAQNIPAFTFNNLGCVGTGNKTATGALVVNGTLTVNSGIILNMSTFALSGTITSSGTGTVSTQNTSAAPLPSATWTCSVNYNSASAQTVVSGNYLNLDCSGGNRTLSNSGTIGISRTFTPGAGIFTVTGSTVDFNGNVAQNIPTFNFSNLTSSSTGSRVLGASIGVAGTFTPGSNSYTVTGSTVDFNGATQNIPPFTYNNLTCSGSGDKTATGAITVNATLTVNSGRVFDMSTFALSGITSTSGTGTLRTQNTSSSPLPEGDTWTCAVEYNSASAQTIVHGSYSNMNGTNGNRTLSSISPIQISGTFTPGAGTYTVTSSTIDFNGSGSQTIPALNYNNLTSSSTGARTLSGTIGIAGLFTPGANSYTNTGSTINFNGSSAQTIPVFSYNNLTSSSTGSRTLASGIISVAGTFTTGTNSYTVTGSTIDFNGAAQNVPAFTYNNLTCSGSGTKTVTGTIAINSTLTINSGIILNMSTLALTSLGSAAGTGTLRTQNTGGAPLPVVTTWPFTVEYNSASAQTIVSGGYTDLNGTGGNRTLSNSGTVSVSGTFTPGAGTYTVTSSTVNFNGAAQNIASFTFNNLTCGGTGNKTATGNLTVNGTLTINSGRTLDMGTNTLSGVAATSGTGTLSTQSTAATPIPSGKTWTYAVDFSGGTQNVVAGTYASLSCSGSGNKTATGAVAATSLSIASGRTLNMATFQLTGITSTSGTGDLQTQAAGATPIPSGATWTFEINYNGTGAQTVVAGDYTNLTIGGARTTNSVTLVNGGTINISGTFTPSATFTSGNYIVTNNTINFNYNSPQTIPAFNYYNLTSSSSGGRTLAASGTIGVAAVFTPGTNPYTVTGSTVSFNGSSVQTAPVFSYNNLTCNNAAGLQLGGSLSVGGTLTISSGKVTIGANTLTLNGNFSGSAGNSLTCNGSTSALVVGGSGTIGNLFFDQTTPGTTNRLLNLTYNRSSQTITLGNALDVTGSVTPTNGTLASAGFLTLVSNAAGDAKVLQGSGSYMTGTVNVQRYIPSSGRRYRFMSSPVSGATLQDWKNEIYITGNNLPTANQSTTVGQLNWGFDATETNSPTVYIYDETLSGVSSNGWIDPKSSGSNLTGIPLTTTRGYRVYIRGDRSSLNKLNGTDNTQNAVTMDVRAPINTGTIAVPASVLSYTATSGGAANDGWALIGNPYPCGFDWNAFHDAGRTFSSGNYSGTNYSKLNPTAYIFNGATNSYASYNALSDVATGSGFSAGIIPSGSAIFIQSSGSAPSFTFTESNKSSAAPGNLFKTFEGSTLSITLFSDSLSSDNIKIKYLSGSTVLRDAYDIPKIYNPELNLSSYGADSLQLAANVRPLVPTSEIIPLQVYVVRDGTYSLSFSGRSGFGSATNIYLKDEFLNTIQEVTENFVYTFTVTPSNTHTQGKGRFKILIGTDVSLPVSLLGFAAKRMEGGEIQLDWSTASEKNNRGFEIEHSTDGVYFDKLAFVEGRNGNRLHAYIYMHEKAAADQHHFYRLKQIDFDGAYSYSAVVLVAPLEKTKSIAPFTIYPNPASNRIRILNDPTANAAAGIKVTDLTGSIVLSNDNLGGDPYLDVQLLRSGVYFITVTESGTGQVYTIKFVKN